MKKQHLISGMFLLFAYAACNKDVKLHSGSAMQNNNSVAFTDTERVPINDLGTGTYMGVMGGLYPGGVNDYSGRYKKDLKSFATAIKPLNGPGVVDSVKGKILFISMGASTSGHLMDSLKQKTIRDSAHTNPYLRLLNCSNGGGVASLQQIANLSDPYWDHVTRIILNSKSTYKQVQVIYMETEDSVNNVFGFPDRPNMYRDHAIAAIQACKTKCPNLKFIYVLGRTTTFGDVRLTNKEPSPYYCGWGWKFLIEAQINGAAGTQYKGDSAIAPMVTWGWYEWANGTNVPRQDGFTWQESDTEDGIHATPAGEDTLSTRFKNFLLTDRMASIWYKKH